MINARTKEAVCSIPGIRGGSPVIKGTRIPVRLVGKLTRAGLSYAEFARDYGITERKEKDCFELVTI